MKTDGRVLLGAILGKVAEGFYVKQIEDFMYFVRSLSLVETKTDEEKIKERLREVISTVLQKTVKYFLSEKCGKASDGTIKVIIIDKEIHDINGKLVEEVIEFKKNLSTISDQIIELGMEEFEKGRIIAFEITERLKDSTNKIHRKVVQRDYTVAPPLEQMEVEMIRLEKKLPFLSHEEGRKLADLYDRWHHVDAEKEMYLEKI
jgi:hypothetical protein